MSTPGIPLISAFPQFGGGSPAPPDDLAAASPAVQSLLSGTGGQLGNTDAMGAANPHLGALMSLMSPPGGLSPDQASQFGPIFALMMALQGGQGGSGVPPTGS